MPIDNTVIQTGIRIGSRAAIFKRPLLSVDVMVGMYDSIEQYPL